MIKINVRFERDQSTDDIDVVIRAAEKDDQILSLIEKLAKLSRKPDLNTSEKLTAST